VRMLALLQDHPRKPDFDADALAKLAQLRAHFETVYQELDAFTSHKNEVVDNDALLYQVPGGMLSNFRNQLKEQQMEDKFEEVFREIPYVRKALGWIPLVTPTSQIVGVQSMLNVKFGRWKNFSPQAMDIALGYYGTPPAAVDEEVRAIAARISGKDPITCRPADLKEPGMAKIKAELEEKGLPATDEVAVIYTMFPMETEKVLHPPAEPPAPTPSPAPAQEKIADAPSPVSGNGRNLAISIDGHRHVVQIEEL